MDNEFREPWRFWSKVERADNGCWQWMGGRTTNGYGSCLNYLEQGEQRKTIHAHRLSWLIAHGSIPDGLQIDHLCRNRLCVNPGHLEPVTQRENLHRGDTMAAHNASKTHCKSGHAFSEANTRQTATGRICRQCNRDAQREWRRVHQRS